MMRSLKGHLLVASPHLQDSNFAKTVVLMLQHDKNGAFGIVLNRPSQKSVAEIWEMIGEENCEVDHLVYLGGPITGPLLALHTHDLFSEEKVISGVYFAAQKEYLSQIIASPNEKFKLFSGYSGWGAGQLENELKLGGWLTTRAKVEHVFAGEELDNEDLWRKVVNDIGNSMIVSALKIKHVPDDPSSN